MTINRYRPDLNIGDEVIFKENPVTTGLKGIVAWIDDHGYPRINFENGKNDWSSVSMKENNDWTLELVKPKEPERVIKLGKWSL